MEFICLFPEGQGRGCIMELEREAGLRPFRTDKGMVIRVDERQRVACMLVHSVMMNVRSFVRNRASRTVMFLATEDFGKSF